MENHALQLGTTCGCAAADGGGGGWCTSFNDATAASDSGSSGGTVLPGTPMTCAPLPATAPAGPDGAQAAAGKLEVVGGVGATGAAGAAGGSACWGWGGPTAGGGGEEGRATPTAEVGSAAPTECHAVTVVVTAGAGAGAGAGAVEVVSAEPAAEADGTLLPTPSLRIVYQQQQQCANNTLSGAVHCAPCH